jgi:hypothetical protein
MSRSATPAPAQPMQAQTNQHNSMPVPREKIAMRAYEKWVKRGRPVTNGEQDWLEAEKELRNETTRGPVQNNMSKR